MCLSTYPFENEIYNIDLVFKEKRQLKYEKKNIKVICTLIGHVRFENKSIEFW